MRCSWMCLAAVGIFGFGLVAAVASMGGDSLLYRADGHVHQGVFFVLSLAGLLLPIRVFFRASAVAGSSR